MGTFNANIEIGSPDGSRFETVNALVDTGSSLTAIPAPILHRLGVTPHRKTPSSWLTAGKSSATLARPGCESPTGQ